MCACVYACVRACVRARACVCVCVCVCVCAVVKFVHDLNSGPLCTPDTYLLTGLIGQLITLCDIPNATGVSCHTYLYVQIPPGIPFKLNTTAFKLFLPQVHIYTLHACCTESLPLPFFWILEVRIRQTYTHTCPYTFMYLSFSCTSSFPTWPWL